MDSVLLPDVDSSGMMLDLASGELIQIPSPEKDPKSHEILLAIDTLAKGDLVYDAGTLILVRGSTAEEATQDDLFPVKRVIVTGRPPIPLEVTTREGRRFLLTVRKAEKEGCYLEWHGMPDVPQVPNGLPHTVPP